MTAKKGLKALLASLQPVDARKVDAAARRQREEKLAQLAQAPAKAATADRHKAAA